MSAPKHTPGPWRLDYPDGWGGAFVERAHEASGSPLICSLYERQWVFPPDDDEREANGRLIAAAPELLEHLCAIAGYADAPHVDPRKSLAFILETARAAIAKATGSAA